MKIVHNANKKQLDYNENNYATSAKNPISSKGAAKIALFSTAILAGVILSSKGISNLDYAPKNCEGFQGKVITVYDLPRDENVNTLIRLPGCIDAPCNGYNQVSGNMGYVVDSNGVTPKSGINGPYYHEKHLTVIVKPVEKTGTINDKLNK